MANTVVMVIFKKLENKHLFMSSQCPSGTQECPNGSHDNLVSKLNGQMKFGV